MFAFRLSYVSPTLTAAKESPGSPQTDGTTTAAKRGDRIIKNRPNLLRLTPTVKRDKAESAASSLAARRLKLSCRKATTAERDELAMLALAERGKQRRTNDILTFLPTAKAIFNPSLRTVSRHRVVSG